MERIDIIAQQMNSKSSLLEVWDFGGYGKWHKVTLPGMAPAWSIVSFTTPNAELDFERRDYAVFAFDVTHGKPMHFISWVDERTAQSGKAKASPGDKSRPMHRAEEGETPKAPSWADGMLKVDMAWLKKNPPPVVDWPDFNGAFRSNLRQDHIDTLLKPSADMFRQQFLCQFDLPVAEPSEGWNSPEADEAAIKAIKDSMKALKQAQNERLVEVLFDGITFSAIRERSTEAYMATAYAERTFNDILKCIKAEVMSRVEEIAGGNYGK